MSSGTLTALAAAALHVQPVPERVLEICCGSGDAVLFLAREFPAARVRGVDPSEQAVRAAVARVGLDPEGRVAFKQGRPTSLPFPGEHFDLVVQRRGRLRVGEAARVLRPGGHLIYCDVEGPLSRLGRAWTRAGLARRGIETAHRVEADDTALCVARRRGG